LVLANEYKSSEIQYCVILYIIENHNFFQLGIVNAARSYKNI